MKWRVAERKLQFMSKIHTKHNDNVAKRTLNNEVIIGLKSECNQLAREVNINGVYWTWQSKESIKNAVKEVNIKEIKTELLKTRKVEDRWQEDCKKRVYLSYRNLREARVWIRFRSRMIAGVKANKSSMHRSDMTCKCYEGDEAET